MRVSKISGGYPGGFYLKKISFVIEKGKMYALLGLNGSGKTTILKMICGLLKTESGNVFVENIDILSLTEKERAKIISYVPQESNIVYDMSVLDVILMGISPYLKIFQSPNRKHVEQAYSLLKKLGIEDLGETNYQILSGGLKRIVIIARALLQNGEYMILDEPDSNLDLINKHKLMKKIREITDTYQKGCLISMHDPEYALNYCDNILLLREGRILEIDLNTEDKISIENKLREIYGNIKILQYKQKYVFYYE